jgi:hypothetical protein
MGGRHDDIRSAQLFPENPSQDVLERSHVYRHISARAPLDNRRLLAWDNVIAIERIQQSHQMRGSEGVIP